jgi:hypothetical protein
MRAHFTAKCHAGCVTLIDNLKKTHEKYILKFEYRYVYKFV